jgi:putative endonuclease
MRPDRSYCVCILSSNARVLYTGSTSDLLRRVYQHKHGLIPGCTSRYAVTHLVFYECTPDANAAVAREREIKGWTREKKLRLVETVNAGWLDLAAGWFEPSGE